MHTWPLGSFQRILLQTLARTRGMVQGECGRVPFTLNPPDGGRYDHTTGADKQKWWKGHPNMERILEPEIMDGEEQAEVYANADFAEENQGFVDQFLALYPDLQEGTVLDLGCGPRGYSDPAPPEPSDPSRHCRGRIRPHDALGRRCHSPSRI